MTTEPETEAANVAVQRKQALQHITQALTDFAATLPISAQGPFMLYTQAQINIIDPPKAK